MSAARTGNTPLESSLRSHAKKAHIFDESHSVLLILLGQLCDDDCVAILYKNEINILKGKTLILKGHRNKTDGLCDIPISILATHYAIAIIKRTRQRLN